MRVDLHDRYRSSNGYRFKPSNILFLLSVIDAMVETDDHRMVEVKRMIDELDLSMIASTMVRRQGWLKSEIEECIVFYRNYLFLKYKYPDENLAPSKDIDEFWHNHILDTKKYKIDCEKIFGTYLDHDPNSDIDDTMPLSHVNALFARTQDLHKKEFGYPIVGVRYTKPCRLIRRFLGDL